MDQGSSEPLDPLNINIATPSLEMQKQPSSIKKQSTKRESSQPNSRVSNRQSLQSLKSAFSNNLSTSVKESIASSGLMKKKIISNPKKNAMLKGLTVGGVMASLGKTGTMQSMIKKREK